MRRFTFMWLLENYSHCWQDTGEELISPNFVVEMMHSTSWNLKIYPRGCEDPNFISLSLVRSDGCNRPESIEFTLELLIIDAYGRVLESEEDEVEFEKGESIEFPNFSERLGNNFRKKDEISNADILGICCKMCVGEGENIEKEDYKFARTRIAIEKVSFVSDVENCSTLQLNAKNQLDTTLVSEDGLELSGNIFVKREPGSEEEVMVEIFPRSKSHHLIICKMFLINSSGKEVECGKLDTRNYIERIQTFSFPLNIKKYLLEKELEYLTNNYLTLRCMCTFSTGIEFNGIEKTILDLHVTPFLGHQLHDSIFSPFQEKAKSVLNDFEKLYKDQILSDVQLKTMSKAFPAHKSVLCARSPIFRAMLTSNMKEKMTDCIQVEDLDDSTIARFLHFLYTDVLEDLQWESAMKLYYAADKYQVQRLKSICASFMITGLNKRNMGDLLVLADTHADSDLKTAIDKFICRRDRQIFCTHEWESFMETNPMIAMKTMHFYLKNSRD